MSHEHTPPDDGRREAPGPREPDETPDLRAALDLWREDAARAADRIDVTGELADRVVAAAAQGRPLRAVPAGARWYAAAAVLLIAVGVTGTLLARQTEAASRGAAVRFVDIEEALVDVLADDPRYSPGLDAPGREGR